MRFVEERMRFVVSNYTNFCNKDNEEDCQNLTFIQKSDILFPDVNGAPPIFFFKEGHLKLQPTVSLT